MRKYVRVLLACGLILLSGCAGADEPHLQPAPPSASASLPASVSGSSAPSDTTAPTDTKDANDSPQDDEPSKPDPSSSSGSALGSGTSGTPWETNHRICKDLRTRMILAYLRERNAFARVGR